METVWNLTKWLFKRVYTKNIISSFSRTCQLVGSRVIKIQVLKVSPYTFKSKMAIVLLVIQENIRFGAHFMGLSEYPQVLLFFPRKLEAHTMSFLGEMK